MTAATEVTTHPVTAARAELADIRAETWPASEEARWAISWACDSLENAILTYGRLARGQMRPSEVIAPGMAAWHEDPEAKALEYVAGQCGDLVKAAWELLAEYRRREAKGIERAKGWMGR